MNADSEGEFLQKGTKEKRHRDADFLTRDEHG
jgi:hypothetical protein